MRQVINPKVETCGVRIGGKEPHCITGSSAGGELLSCLKGSLIDLRAGMEALPRSMNNCRGQTKNPQPKAGAPKTVEGVFPCFHPS